MQGAVETALFISIFLLFLGPSPSCGFEPHPEIGYPAGLIPECPGVTKNASITPVTMKMLQIIVHRKSEKGQVLRKPFPILTAHRSIAKEKTIDFKNKKTVLYAVGFLDSSVFPQSQAIGTAYSKRGYNVLITETFDFLTYIYPKSVRLTRYIGKKIGEFLVKLTEYGLKAEELELVGASLGAHVVGHAAKHFYAATGKKPSRITGLDPAGPCYRSLPPTERLAITDATKVDIIHTNIDGFGIAERLGHIDFYVNGGEFQPSDIPYIPCLVVCSHIRAILYWWQAIEHPKKFIGVQCHSIQEARLAKCYNNTKLNYVGLAADFNKPGIYYLQTHNEFPYFKGKEGLKEENEVYLSFIRKLNSDDNFQV
ncbi:phospholipase A1-like [Maniola hyperantus]|uniref:phospholipase A1-like n=1 Tax=Aphantopus hyperantus TaxID=2795564 RepID=UPI0015687A4B|nr:phospholipase A1-like [Maniola hyperantus]